MFDARTGGTGNRVGLWLLFALLLAVATGCTATSDYMRPTLAPLDAPPPPGTAAVVFVRPSGWASSVVMTILDDQGRFIGDSTADSCFVTPVPAGKHLFIGWAENTAALQADLEPGRVYFVEVSSRLGWWSARVQLLAVTPHSAQWGKLKDWVSDCDKFRPDEAGGQAYLSSRRDATAEHVRRGKEKLGDYDSEELAERTLHPADGVSPTLYAPPVTAPPPATLAPPLPPPPPAPLH
ncbi:MAG: hypothetical protein ABI488_24570 [Polyangiaceae bacterium]